jgi:uncharacterized protein (TIGR02611 family)
VSRPEIVRRWARWRESFRHRRVVNVTYRIVVGVVGLVIFAVGIVAIPYPGPGWAIVIVGLGVLATEFDWARHWLSFARKRYDAVTDWFRRQGRWVQAVGATFSAAVVLTTLWLLGALGWSADLVGIEHPSLRSPIGLGS